METVVRLCAVCGIPCTLSCGKCKNSHYCSKDHQTSHWTRHKTSCFPVKIAEDAVSGRYLVATRNIQQGEILLKEHPLISGPSFQAMKYHHEVCITCYRVIASDFSCFHCKWPLCDKGCEEADLHQKFDCPILSKNNVTPADEFKLHYRSIFILRGLLQRDQDPEKWNKINQLESHLKHRESSDDNCASAISFIRDECGLQDRFTEEDIKLISGILNTNAMASDDGPQETQCDINASRFGSYLYHNASLISHGCVPKTVRTIQPNSELFIRATIPISEGEPITTAYLDVTVGTRERQKHFLLHYYFKCSCARCVDPTELGTHFSSLKCPAKCIDHDDNSSKGYMLPVDPRDLETDWKCNNENCQVIIPSEAASEIITKIDTALKEIPYEDTLENIQLLEKLLEEKCKVSLHANHYVVHQIKYDLLQRIDYVLSASIATETKIRIGLTKRQIELTTLCLELIEVLVPGFSRCRGRLIYFQQKAKIMVILFQIDVNKLVNNHTMKQELRKEFEEVMNLRKEGYNILRHEPKTRDEGFLADAMQKDDRIMLSIKQYFGL